jgi:exonuclease VII small subunit
VTLPCQAPLHKEPHRENAKELHVYPPTQGAWQRPDDHGAGPPPDASPTPPVPDTFDEIVPDRPLTAEADFAPLQELGPAERADLTEVDPYQADSLHAQAAFERAVAAAAQGDEALAIAEYLKASKIAETAREWYLAAVACHRVGDFLQHPRPPVDLERAFRMYRRAIAAYEQCGLSAEARHLTYALMRLRLRRARVLHLPMRQRLELALYWATAGFGLRPLRVIGTALTLVLLYGLAYWALAGVVAVHTPAPLTLWDTIYFSGITFATVGYGDFLPAPHARLLALTEGVIGVFTMGFFVVVLANRLRR